MVPGYQVVSLDLAAARERFRLSDAGQAVESITVLQLPAGSSCSLHLGPSAQGIPLLIGAQLFAICPALDEGAFFTNALGAGIVILLISFSNLTVSNP